MASRALPIDRRLIRDARGHHPWRTIGMFPAWKVEFTCDLPVNDLGHTVHAEKRIQIHACLNQAARRSVLCHETGHVLRGPVGRRRTLAEEAYVERQASRLLLPSVLAISHALAWHSADHEQAAAELWVDEQLLHTRLSTLTPRQRERLNEQLATILV